jgi:hypothetical protein
MPLDGSNPIHVPGRQAMMLVGAGPAKPPSGRELPGMLPMALALSCCPDYCIGIDHVAVWVPLEVGALVIATLREAAREAGHLEALNAQVDQLTMTVRGLAWPD